MILSPRSPSSHSGERIELNHFLCALLWHNAPWDTAAPCRLDRLPHEPPEQNHSAVRNAQLFAALSEHSLRRLGHDVFLADISLERNVFAPVVRFNFFFGLFLHAQ